MSSGTCINIGESQTRYPRLVSFYSWLLCAISEKRDSQIGDAGGVVKRGMPYSAPDDAVA